MALVTSIRETGKVAVFTFNDAAALTPTIDASTLLHANFTLTLVANGTDLKVGDLIETASNVKAFRVLSVASATSIVVSTERRTDTGAVSASPADADNFTLTNGAASANSLVIDTAGVTVPAHLLSVTKVAWSIAGTAPFQQLSWDATADVLFLRMSGNGVWLLGEHALTLKNDAGAGVTGNILVTAAGATITQSQLIIECKKEDNFGTTVSTNLQQ